MVCCCLCGLVFLLAVLATDGLLRRGGLESWYVSCPAKSLSCTPQRRLVSYRLLLLCTDCSECLVLLGSEPFTHVLNLYLCVWLCEERSATQPRCACLPGSGVGFCRSKPMPWSLCRTVQSKGRIDPSLNKHGAAVLQLHGYCNVGVACGCCFITQVVQAASADCREALLLGWEWCVC